MKIQDIMAEADVKVPNVFSQSQKATWLNEVNAEFFDIVKIPKSFIVQTDGVKDSFVMDPDAREKNFKRVIVGSSYYRSMHYENVTAAFNYFVFDEATKTITLSPKPTADRLIIVYDKGAVSTFVSSDLTAEPESPAEHHWVYILGLCVRIAKAMNDVSVANNYENDFKNALAVIQQNYLRG